MKEPNWNLYAKIENGKVQELILPNESTLELPPAPAGEGWHVVAWPVNPHFTGKSIIAMMIENAWEKREKVAA